MLDELLDFIQEYRTNMLTAWDEALQGVEIPDDEHFESDDWYQGCTDTCELIINKIWELRNA